MKLGSIVLASVCGMVGLVAGRVTRPVPAVVSAAPVRAEPARVVAAPMPVAAEAAPADPDGDDAEGVDLGEAIASAKAHAAEHIADHNTIRGTITQRDNGPAVGATVVMASPNHPSQVVITDEHGQYMVTQLPAGSYTMTVYYNERTIERSGVIASEFFATTQDDVIEPEPPRQFQWEGPSDMTNTYTVDIPVRTFEEALGAAAGEQGDLGVTFSGGTYLENTYIVDETGEM